MCFTIYAAVLKRSCYNPVWVNQNVTELKFDWKMACEKNIGRSHSYINCLVFFEGGGTIFKPRGSLWLSSSWCFGERSDIFGRKSGADECVKTNTKKMMSHRAVLCKMRHEGHKKVKSHTARVKGLRYTWHDVFYRMDAAQDRTQNVWSYLYEC